MASITDDAKDLVSRKARVEKSIAESTKAIQHWRSWDASYSALKETLEAIAEGNRDIRTELDGIKRDFEGDVLTSREIDDIVGTNAQRRPAQIISLLDNRLDYVARNIQILERRLENDERHLSDLDSIETEEENGAAEENSAPITEVVEYLDADDNVLSYQLKKEGESLNRVEDMLQKTNITDPGAQTPGQPGSTSSASTLGPRPQAQQMSPNQRDSVEELPETTSNVPLSNTTRRLQNIMANAKRSEEISKETPIIPEDESPEDAELRQEMLRYGLGEVGAIVAELQVEEIGSDDDDFYDYDYEDDDEDSQTDEEDKYGRSVRSVLTDDYQERMIQLEQQLGVQSRFTRALQEKQAEEGNAGESGAKQEGIGRIVVNQEEEEKPKPTTPAPKPKASDVPPVKSALGSASGAAKKSVRFAEHLDINSEEVRREPSPPPPARRRANEPDPLSDVVERRGTPQNAPVRPKKKLSKFKQRASGSQPAVTDSAILPKGPLDAPARFHEPSPIEKPTPTGPSGTTIADSIVEHPVTAAPPVDETIEISDNQELVDEYHRRRRIMINRGGGFLKEDNSPVQPLDEEEGGPRRMSKFKAARLSSTQMDWGDGFRDS